MSEWKEVSREPVDNSVRVIPATYKGTVTYAQMYYRVTESRVVHGVREIRCREVPGKPLYLHQTTGETRMAMKVAAVVLHDIELTCYAHDQGHESIDLIGAMCDG